MPRIFLVFLMGCLGVWGQVNVLSYGAVGDGATDDSAAFQSAINSLTGPGYVYVPARNYWLGTGTGSPANYAPIINILRSGVTIHGEGIGSTVLKYSSINKGSLFQLGSGNTPYYNISITDLTIQDVNTQPVSGSGHNPAAIDSFSGCSDRIERVEIIDAKGNAAITSAQAHATCGDTESLVVRQCYIHGTEAGGYVEGDAINFGHDNALISDNRMVNILRGCIEGGSSSKNFRITNNICDKQGLGLGGFGNITGQNSLISNNSILNLGPNQTGIYLIADAGGSVSGLRITQNVITYSRTCSYSIRASANFSGPLEISNNQLTFLYLGTLSGLASTLITGNQFNMCNLGGNPRAVDGYVYNGGVAIQPGQTLSIIGNTMVNVRAPSRVVGLNADIAWKTNQLRVAGNVIGVTLDDAWTGQIDGNSRDVFQIAPLAPFAISTDRMVGMLGALTTDRVTAFSDTPIETGLQIVAWVNSPDLILWHVVNNSGILVSPAPRIYRFVVSR